MWDLLACSSALLSVAHSLTSAARSLRAVVLGGLLETLLERPLVWPGPVVSLSHAPAQQPPAQCGGPGLPRALLCGGSWHHVH